jgi:hypothetical protein
MKTHLLKTENNGVTDYKLVNNNEEWSTKGLKLFIPYRPVLYKGVECQIISDHLNYSMILFENEEIKVTSTQIQKL